MFWKPRASDEEVSRLRSEVQSLREELIEVRDKVYGWMKRVEMRGRASEREVVPAEQPTAQEHLRRSGGRILFGGGGDVRSTADDGGPGAA